MSPDVRHRTEWRVVGPGAAVGTAGRLTTAAPTWGVGMHWDRATAARVAAHLARLGIERLELRRVECWEPAPADRHPGPRGETWGT